MCVLRYKAEEQRFDLKHKRKLEELKAKGDATSKELEQLHNEKRELGGGTARTAARQREGGFGCISSAAPAVNVRCRILLLCFIF